MGYMHIDNLYKNDLILIYKKVYCLEKIHGTSANISYSPGAGISFFAGGAKHEEFIKLFDADKLTPLLAKYCPAPECWVVIYGEAYGGKMQAMSKTYGGQLRFVVFDVRMGPTWLDVPDAENVARDLGLEFVSYELVECTVANLNAQRDLPSVQAVRNGILEPREREGIVIRPIREMELSKHGERVIAKHKSETFCETAHHREVGATQSQAKLDGIKAADEWVTPNRLASILGKKQNVGLEHTKEIIADMIEDITREGKGEVEMTPATRKAIGNRTAKLFKQMLQAALEAKQ
jgi:hypothetical protein